MAVSLLGGLQLTVQLIHTRGEGSHPLPSRLAIARLLWFWLRARLPLLTNESLAEMSYPVHPASTAVFRVLGFLVGNAANGKASGCTAPALRSSAASCSPTPMMGARIRLRGRSPA
ncbi:MAG: hypothetical protein ACLSF2_09210 [Butyricicoccus sp.]